MKNSYEFTNKDTLCIKALAVMLMVAHHVLGFPDRLLNGASFNNLITFADGRTSEILLSDYGKLCVGLFMLLSGYGIYCSYRKDSDKISSIIAKRIKSVYIKYWQIFIIFIPLGMFLGIEKITHTKVDLITNFFAISTTFNDEAWFLTSYVMMILIAPIIISWFNRKRSNIWSDIVCIIIFSLLTNTALLNFISKNQYFVEFNSSYIWQKSIFVITMLPMFATGCLLAKYDVISNIRNSIKSTVASKIIALVMLYITFILRENWQARAMWGWDRYDFIYAAVFCIAFAMLLDGSKYIKMGLAFIGKQATGIWLIHTFLCYYYFQDIMYSSKNPIIIYMLVFSLSLGIAWGISNLMRVVWSLLTTEYNKYIQKVNSKKVKVK